MPRTRRVDSDDPGIRRVRRGRGFGYHDQRGRRIGEREVIERIEALAIPPAWTEVWICPDPRGHLQATGFDEAGRKQYRYHDDWRAHRDRLKFEEMLEFARRLPRLRRRIDAGLGERGLVLERVCACAAALLDLGLFRIGSERYEDDHGSYGLTTLKVRHLSFERGAAIFEFPGKGGERVHQRISHASVLPVLRALAHRGEDDENLLRFREGRAWRELGPERLNDWIKQTLGDGFSAKDFRTWHATVLAAVVLARHEDEATSKTARRRLVTAAVREVAEYLSNTPAVCRSSYIDSRVFDRFHGGETIRPALRRLERSSEMDGFLDRAGIERAVIRLLED